MIDEIKVYINKMREAGKSDEKIRSALVKEGWKEENIPIFRIDKREISEPLFKGSNTRI